MQTGSGGVQRDFLKRTNSDQPPPPPIPFPPTTPPTMMHYMTYPMALASWSETDYKKKNGRRAEKKRMLLNEITDALLQGDGPWVTYCFLRLPPLPES